MTTLSQIDLPQHLESLVASEWGIWRWFVLRGAGFPAELIKGLAQPRCAEFADNLIAAEDQVQVLFQQAIRSFNEILDQLSRQGDDRHGASFKAVLSARRKLAEGKIPQASDPASESALLFSEIGEAVQTREQLKAEWNKTFADSLTNQEGALRGLACDPM